PVGTQEVERRGPLDVPVTGQQPDVPHLHPRVAGQVPSGAVEPGAPPTVGRVDPGGHRGPPGRARRTGAEGHNGTMVMLASIRRVRVSVARRSGNGDRTGRT